MHKTCAGVAQIVKADFTQTVPFKNLRECVLDVTRFEAVAHFVGENVVNIVHIVTVIARSAVEL